MKKTAQVERKDNSVFIGILKGVLYAVVISLISVLVFAFVLRFVPIADSAISPVNQVIKGLSILFGTIIGLKKSKEMGLISGLLIGFFYTMISFFVFSILSREFKFSKTLINDLMFGSIIGGISGIIAVNLKKKK
ncbi:MAG: TIGR04086 family membrane protein [Christensenellales bacterium]|jgi:putative membrane protein (TIGR04086 family)